MIDIKFNRLDPFPLNLPVDPPPPENGSSTQPRYVFASRRLFSSGLQCNRSCILIIRFCPLIMPAGRPKQVDPGALYAFAHQFYWDFKRLADGRYRLLQDEGKYKRLVHQIEKNGVQLSEHQRATLEAAVEREVRTGQLEGSDRKLRMEELEGANLEVTRDWLLRLVGEEATKQIRVPGEPEVLRALLAAKSPEGVRDICQDSAMIVESRIHPGRMIEVSAWPIAAGSVLPTYLSQHAIEFIAAKSNARFPRSDRPSTKVRQLWFLSRALAGAVFGVKTRTAINLVGATNPEQTFREVRAGKAKRTRRRRKRDS
jgi:hypothetical protein